MNRMSINPGLERRIPIIGLLLAMTISVSAKAEEISQIASFDNGNRIVVMYHLKIEHRANSVIDVLVNQLGTPEGRALLAVAAESLGLEPTTAEILSRVVPLPHFDMGATDNRRLFSAPQGMTTCRAGHGYIESSNASWDATLARNANQDGLRLYTSVGTSPGTTHRVQGDFYVEYVKPIGNWKEAFQCMDDNTRIW